MKIENSISYLTEIKQVISNLSNEKCLPTYYFYFIIRGNLFVIRCYTWLRTSSNPADVNRFREAILESILQEDSFAAGEPRKRHSTGVSNTGSILMGLSDDEDTIDLSGDEENEETDEVRQEH